MGNPRRPAKAWARALIVDDHPALRHALALLLAQEGVEILGEARGCADTLALVDRQRPGLVLVDLSLGEEDGTPLVAELHARGVPVLVYSMHDDPDRVVGAFAAGALGYVAKHEPQEVLVQALHEVARGLRFVSPAASLALAEGVGTRDPAQLLGRLSAHERQVYELLGQGADMHEIATTLRVSPHTVESYYGRILVKLDLSGMHELRRHAIGHVNGRGGEGAGGRRRASARETSEAPGITSRCKNSRRSRPATDPPRTPR